MSDLNIFSVEKDAVIKSVFVNAQTTYQFALDNLVPLIGTLAIQREIQNPKFYDRLARDLADGCIMPAITLAIVDAGGGPTNSSSDAVEKYIISKINRFFVLDGMQRLNTLSRSYKQHGADFPVNRPLFLNILICKSMDLLLYRMITLNNGQKPMSARHQIEIVAANLYDFDESDVLVLTEKKKPGEHRRQGAFKKADLIKAYLAYLSESVNIDNDKIIQEKMDELIASRIMHSDLTKSDKSFDAVMDQVEKLYLDGGKTWILVQNNLIGFSAGARKSLKALQEISTADILATINRFESAFAAINVSKIKLGNARRKGVEHLIANISRLAGMDSDEILDEISQEL
jgi:hypothetical protein